MTGAVALTVDPGHESNISYTYCKKTSMQNIKLQLFFV